MKDEIKQYCKACIKCAENRKVSPRAPLHPLQTANAPFETIAIDFLGPFKPKSTQGNSYLPNG